MLGARRKLFAGADLVKSRAHRIAAVCAIRVARRCGGGVSDLCQIRLTIGACASGVLRHEFPAARRAADHTAYQPTATESERREHVLALVRSAHRASGRARTPRHAWRDPRSSSSDLLRDRSYSALKASLRLTRRFCRPRLERPEGGAIVRGVLRMLACLLTAATAGGALALTASGESTACQPTRNDGAGPFQQSGLSAPRRAKIGTGHVLLGRVLGTDFKPVAGALVVLWQAGPNGYGPRGRGSVRTDRSGRFRFEGPVPASEGYGVPHIHIAVFHPGFEELVTRYIVRRGAKTGRIRLVLAPLLS